MQVVAQDFKANEINCLAKLFLSHCHDMNSRYGIEEF